MKLRTGRGDLSTAEKMDRFLASVEKKAFRIAQIAVKNDEDALDLVQDSMMKLTQKYLNKTESDWPGLFYTILNSRINDWYRRTKVRNRWRVWFSSTKTWDQDVEYDPIVAASDEQGATPEQHLEYEDSASKVEKALAELPLRQKQAFLLRMWEGFSVEETAKIMKCSQGSVKTHCSRALSKLKLELAEN